MSFLIIFSFLIMLIDQTTKYLIRLNMSPHETIPIIENFFHITYVENPGAAFSVLKGKTTFFIVVSLIVIFFIGYTVVTIPVKKKKHLLILAFILGGAMGNLVDRIFFGSVIDFLDFRIWPVFNVADCAIVIGVFLLTYVLLFDQELDDIYGGKSRG